jgi:hypothetical protein
VLATSWHERVTDDLLSGIGETTAIRSGTTSSGQCEGARRQIDRIEKQLRRIGEQL